MIFVMDDKSLVLTSEIWAKHIEIDQLGYPDLVEQAYKKGLSNKQLQQAIDEVHGDVFEDFGPVERMLWEIVMMGCIDNLYPIIG